MHNVSGIPQTDAQKSNDMFMKCRYLDEITGGKGIVFATGTPVSNSMVELYTMQRYLQYDDLVKAKLEHFDNWASTFGETITALELAPEGTGFKSKTRFAKFHNLPELMSLFKNVADIQTADTLNLPTPKVITRNIFIKPNEIQQEMVKGLGERAEKIRTGSVDPSKDNMLKITNEGRKLALDQRLLNERLSDFEESKINVAAKNIYEIWEENKRDRLTQLVFCDLSTPRKLEANDNPYEMEQIDGKWQLKERQFTDVYTDLKRKLIAKGIPEKEIAFIHDADNEVKKKELFSKVRKGDIRVLIGSTSKMGAGTNCQDKIIALHHLDCPFRPADLTQRNGRGVRQGNQNKEIYIYTYITEKTFDAYMFQGIEIKQKYISQIMTSKTPARTMEDVDEKALNYGEIKALATGNKEIIKKIQLDTDVAKLKILKQNYLSQIYDLENKITNVYPQKIKELEEVIKLKEIDKKHLEENTKLNADGFSKMTINGVSYSDKENAGNALLKACSEKQSKEFEYIGEYRGFKLELGFDATTTEFKLKIEYRTNWEISLGNDTYGNIKRIDNSFKELDSFINDYKEEIEDIQKQLEVAKNEVQKPFSKEIDLKEKMKELEQINITLKINEKDKQILDTSNENEEKKEDKKTNKEKSYVR